MSNRLTMSSLFADLNGAPVDVDSLLKDANKKLLFHLLYYAIKECFSSSRKIRAGAREWILEQRKIQYPGFSFVDTCEHLEISSTLRRRLQEWVAAHPGREREIFHRLRDC